MTDSTVIPEATTLGEVNIKLGYLHNGIETLKKLIEDQSIHYVNQDEFAPVVDQLKKNTSTIENHQRWIDTFTGKLIGFGVAIAVVSSAIDILVRILFHI